MNGTIEGSVQQLTGESVSLNGGATITKDLLVPGTPTVNLSGHPGFGGTLTGTGSASPTGYQVTLNGNAVLGKLRTRTNPIPMPVVGAPAAPGGTRNVTINSAGESAGSWSTLRNLTLNGNVGQYAVPPGAYGDLLANGESGFIFGVAGGTQPAIYNLQHLTLNGKAQIQVVGPVIINLANGFAANGTLGTPAEPFWLVVNIASGDFSLNAGCTMNGYVTAPSGTITVNGNSTLNGGVISDRLTINGGGLLRLWQFDGNPGANQPPVANPQNTALDEDVPAAIVLTGNDPESATLSFTVLTQPAHGALAGTAPNLSYTPAPDYNGPDSFTFKVGDGQMESGPAPVSITVRPVNDAPVAQSQAVTLSEDKPVSITLIATDVEGDPISYSLTGQPSHGALSGTAPNLTYTPAADYNGPDSFSFKANDGQADSGKATVTLNVAPVEDVPAARNLSMQLPEDQSAQITLAGVDADGDALEYAVTFAPEHGSLDGTSPNLTYTPNANYRGPDSFSYTAFDGVQTSAPATVSITVIPVNDAPEATPIVVSTQEDMALPIVLSGTDADGDPLSCTVVTPPAHGSLSGTAPNLTYTPAPDFNGADAFTFKANDGQADSAPASVAVNIEPANDAPVATPLTLQTNENAALPIVLNGTDVDGDGLAYSIPEAPAHGTLTGIVPDLVYAPNPGFSGTDTFSYKASDGTVDSTVVQVVIEVILINEAPVVDAGADQTIRQPYAAMLTGTAADDGLPSGKTLAVSWTKVSGPGAVTFQTPDAAITKANFSVKGAYVLRFTGNDSGLSASDDVTVKVEAQANQAPLVNAGAGQELLASQVATLTGSATDDGLPASGGLSIGWTQISGPGTVTFADAAQPHTSATFSSPGTYELQLGASDSQYTRTATVSVTVHPANLAPVVSTGKGQSVAVFSGANLQGSVNDDGLPLGSAVTVQWSKVSGPGEVVFGTGAHTATTANFSVPGTYVLRLLASDTELSASSDLVVIVESPENKAPVVNAGANRQIGFSTTARLSCQVTDDGLPTGGAVTSTWSKVSGPGNVVFDDAASLITNVAFSKPGIYVLRLTASDTALSESSDVTITVDYQNQPPKVEAGPDQTITLPQDAGLQGKITDDGLPEGAAINLAWTQVSGSGTATFENAGAAATRVTFSASGSYVLRLTANDSEANGSDEVTVTVMPQPYRSRTYTSTADFAEGKGINIEATVPDQLQLTDQLQLQSLIWVANSTKGTVMKMDTNTEKVLGEYWTSPTGQPRNPSRTTVDFDGSVWVANRDGHSVTHIVTPESGLWVDRNGNGVCDTSTNLNDLRPWANVGGADTNGGVSTATDECVIHYTLVHSWGTRHVSVDSNNDVWVSGAESNLGPIQRFDLIDGRTGAIIRSEPSVAYGGYGGLIDKTGVIWSANPLLRWDTSKPLIGPNGGNWRGYPQSYDGESYGLAVDQWGYVWNTVLYGNIIRKYAPDGTLVGTFQHGADTAQGCVVDANGDVWTANSLSSQTVGHLKNDGTFIGVVQAGNCPTGVAVDANGKIWVTNRFSHTVMRIDPKAGPIGADGVTPVGQVDFTSQDFGGELYNYSDMTGSTLYGKPPHGIWAFVYDCGLAAAQWGKISWNASIFNDGKLDVSVASSVDGTTFGESVPIQSTEGFGVPEGRYLKVIVNLSRASTGESPILYDLTVGTKETPMQRVNLAPELPSANDVFATVGQKTAFGFSVKDDGLPFPQAMSISWSKISGPGEVVFDDPNAFRPKAVFDTEGMYVLQATASDGELSSERKLTVVAHLANQAPSVYAGGNFSHGSIATATTLQGWAADDGLPVGSALATLWSKLDGPGDVSFGDATAVKTTASFSQPGLYLLKLTASDGMLNASSLSEIRVAMPRALVSPPGLVAWWPANGTGADVVGGSTAYSIHSDGTLGPVTNFGPGKVSMALNFPGTAGESVVVPPTPALDISKNGAMSVEFWWNYVHTGNDVPLIRWTNVGSDGFRISENWNHNVYVGWNGSEFFAAAPSENSWHHVAATYDASSQFTALYFDGTLVASQIRAPFAALTSGTIFMGMQPPGGWPMNGKLDEICLYNRALTIEEIQSIYAAGSNGKYRPGGNEAPIVDAGPDTGVPSASLPVSLNGKVCDDGLPGDAVTTLWSKMSGPGNVAFDHENSPATLAHFDAPGLYILRLTADDGAATASAQVTIRVADSTPVSLPVGAVAWWPGDGDLVDVIGGQSALNLKGVNFVPGEAGMAMNFQGRALDCVRVPSRPALDIAKAGAMSVEFWWNYTHTSSDVVLVRWTDPATNTDGFRISENWDHNIYVGWYGSEFHVTAPSQNAWHHVAVTYDRTTGLTLAYIDGRVQGQSVRSPYDKLTSGDLFFGSVPTSSYAMNGQMDEIALYNRVLSSDEINAIYLAGAAGKPLPGNNAAPVVDAGSDVTGAPTSQPVTLNGIAGDDGLPSGNLAINWSKISGPGNVVFTNSTLANTTATFDAPGQYQLALKADDGERVTTDTVTVWAGRPAAQVPNGLVAWWPGEGNFQEVVSGTDGIAYGAVGFVPGKVGQAMNFNLGLDTIRYPAVPGINPVAATGAMTVEFWWNYVHTDSDIVMLQWYNFSNPSSPILFITENWNRNTYFGSSVNYTSIVAPSENAWHHVALTYSASTGICTLFIDGVYANSVNAGANLPLTTGDLLFGGNMGGHASMKGQMDEVSLYNRVLSASEIQTIYQAGASGKTPLPKTPGANAGPVTTACPAQTIVLPQTASVSGTATDDGLPTGSSLHLLWQCIGGPGTVTFDHATAASSQATFSMPGVYRLAFMATDGALSTSAFTTVTVLRNPAGDPPVVNASPSQTGFVNGNVFLNGSLSDDGLPVGGQLTAQWSQVSGPGVATFSSPQSAATRVSFSLPGDYVLRLTGNDSALSGFGEVAVRVYPSTNSAPSVNAGPSRAFSISEAATLAGTATDDGLPLGGSLTVGWRKVSGPGSVTFASPSAANTTARFGAMGTYVLELSADDSEKWASSEVTLVVGVARNTAPVISAGADQSVAYGLSATVTPSIDDDYLPNGVLSVKWAQVGGPATIQAELGEGDSLSVTAPKIGSYVLRLTVGDGEFTVSDDVTVTVTAGALQAPAVQLTSPVSGAAAPQGSVLSLAASASSANGPVESVAFYADGLKIGERAGGLQAIYALTWVANTAGTHTLTAVATDSLGLSGTSIPVQTTVTVAPLAVTLGSPSVNQRYLTGRSVPLSATATGNGIASVSFYSDGALLGTDLAAPFVFSWSSGSVGAHVLTAVVKDNSGATASSSPVAIEIVADSPTPPVLELSSPDEGATITAPTQFKGTVSSPILKSWSLSYRERGAQSQKWVQFRGGTASIENSDLGTLDTTLLRNGLYDIELAATDLGGTSYALDATVVVDGGMKVGNFTLAFNDLQIPMAGIPITVTRAYDSRVARAGEVGDFGVGWDLDVNSIHLDKNLPLGDAWYADVQPPPTGNPFEIPVYSIYDTSPHAITVSFPDGKTCRFRPVLKLKSSGAPLQRAWAPYTSGDVLFMDFEQMPGTQGKLIARGIPASLYMQDDSYGCPILLSTISGDWGGDHGFADANGFDYVSQEGRTFSFDNNGKLAGMRDRNGNAVSFDRDPQGTLNSITHTSEPDGHLDPAATKSLQFVRDGQKRITKIVDPKGRALNYQYSAEGDLVAFFDRATEPSAGKATASFSYAAGTHYLQGIVDASGVQAIRNEYDADGRLVKTIDAEGKTILYTHDVAGRTETITDRGGNSTTHCYDDRGNVLSTTDALGHSTSSAYDARNNKLTQTNALGQTAAFTYDPYDRLEAVADALGHSTAFTYNAMAQPLTITDARGHTTTNTYDPAGNLLTSTDPKGNATSYTYDEKGNRTSTTDALGNATTTSFDSQGQAVSKTDALGHATSYTYDPNGNQLTQTTQRTVTSIGSITSTAAQGPQETLTTTRIYDDQDRLIKTIDPDGTFTETIFNELGKQTATNDKLGRQTQQDYDRRGNLTKTTYPDATTELTSYDADGRRLTSTDRAGRVTSFTYDAVGRLIKTTLPDGTFTESTFDAAGRVTASRDVSGVVTGYGYDAAGRRVSVTDTLGHSTATAYDANGNQVSVTDALNRTTTTGYDELNRRIATVFPDGTQTSTVYDALGRRVSETDQNGITKSFGYDKLGRLTSVTDDLGKVTSYSYDELGNQLTQTDANNHTTSYGYDSLGRRTARKLPMGMSETLTYDTVGNLVSRKDFNGKVTGFSYDAMGRLLQRTPDAGLNEPPVNFTYTTDGQRATMADASGSTTYTYDANGRLAQKATPEGALNYGYDAAGALSGVSSDHANGVDVGYSYDALHRLAKVTDTHLGASIYEYDSVGNLAGFTTPNGVTHAYSYNALNRLTSLVVAAPAAGAQSTIASYTYTLAPGGQRTSVTESSGRKAVYAYDALYRLTSETISSDASTAHNGQVGYTFDDVGNRLTRTSTVADLPSQSSAYDANDRLSSDQYDANGNTKLGSTPVSGIVAGAPPATLNSGYDSENHLTSGTRSDGASVTLVYDGDGNKVRETVGGQATSYLVDDRNPTGYAQVVEEIVGGNVTRTYTYGHQLLSQDQLAADGTGGTTGTVWHASFYGYDGHGNVRLLTDETGAVTDRYDYDAFGTLLANPGPTFNRYLYCGEQFDATLGLYNLRARLMNPLTGRFWNADSYEGSKGDPRSLHKYNYCHGDPVNGRDPSGHMELTEQLGGVGIRADWAAQSVPNSVRAFTTISNAAVYATTSILVLSAVAIATWTDYLGNPGGIAVPDQEKFGEYRANGFGENGRCLDYARSLQAKYPRRKFTYIAYRLKPPRDRSAPWGGISALFGCVPYKGAISSEGFHVGVIHRGLVFDNNILGLPPAFWLLNYTVLKEPDRYTPYSFSEADVEGFGQVKIFKDYPPTLLDERWNHPSTIFDTAVNL